MRLQTPGHTIETMRRLDAVIRGACRVYNELPCKKTSTASGDGLCFFYARATTTFLVCPRLSNGMCAAYVTADDVCLTVDAQVVHVQSRLDAKNRDRSIVCSLHAGLAPKQLCVRVHVCGVKLVDVCVHRAFFSGRTGGQFHSRQYMLECGRGSDHYMAIHPAGTHLALSNTSNNCVNVFTLPDFKFAVKLGKSGMGLTELDGPQGLCFTDAGELLITDLWNDRVQHWTLDGEQIASYSAQDPWCVASRGNVAALGGSSVKGVHILSLESGATIKEWLLRGSISAIAFVDAAVLAVSDYVAQTVGLYTLEGALKRQLAASIICHGLAACADGCLLVSDAKGRRVRVFLENGDELNTFPFEVHSLNLFPFSVALHAEHAYVLEVPGFIDDDEVMVCVFE
jgi:hypothetical protein